MRLEALRQEHPGKSEEPTWAGNSVFVWGDRPQGIFLFCPLGVFVWTPWDGFELWDFLEELP